MKNTTVQMKCADEPGFPVRDFHMEDGDGVCAHCGWMQTSFADGLNELVALATWHSETARAAYVKLAAAEKALEVRSS